MLPLEIPQQFSCEISEPSELVVSGTTDLRGLLFINANGFFLNIPYLPNPIVPMPEWAEIQEIVHRTLALSQFQIGPAHVTVTVTADQ